MKILGIETSCDETAVCLIETDKEVGNIKILGNQLYSQIALHAQYGGVFPMMAKREHAKNLIPLFERCLEEASCIKEVRSPILESAREKLKELLVKEMDIFDQIIELAEKIEKPNIDAIAVTNGPGLEPALWVGVNFAKALEIIWNIPIIPTNHMEGHILVAAIDKIKTEESPSKAKETPQFLLKEIKFPAIALLISGGHTQLVLAKDNLQYEIVGNTRDDAVGEAFDKVARILGLPYPGGPQISKLAEKERAENPDKKPPYPLPRPMIHSGDLDFSFSGLKTAVLYTVKKIPEMTEEIKQEIACEFENAVLEVLTKKTFEAVRKYSAKTIIIGGGVSANKKIRNDFTEKSKAEDVELMIPEVNASTDNAFMIALAGAINLEAGKKTATDFRASGNLSL
ncbi:MAG: tRNA (adenosine(37)-N6)-threonylcarbamoyltransferase complex transferase subunit TsaD [Candidatus Paceibacterota bacterium]|jgi:N6-L-threonylcarbamoyladenine synthase